MQRKIIALIFTLVLLFGIASTASAAGYSAYFSKGAKIYSAASTSSRSASISTGTKVTITAVNGSWARIRKNGRTAYCNVKNLTLSKPIKAYIKIPTQLYSSASTASSVVAKAGTNTVVYVVGREGNYFRVTNKAHSKYAYVQARYLSTSKVTTPKASATVYNYSASTKSGETVYAMDWFHGGSGVFAVNSYATIIDISSGMSFRVKRLGGSNHCDLEPATSNDAAILRQICGGKYSWDSRAVLLVVGGKYYACAINSMPHGSQSIMDNDFDGQFCLHMINSRTHGTDSVNTNHQDSIKRAYKWAISNL